MKTKDILFVAWLQVTKDIKFDDYLIIDKRNNIAEFTFNNIIEEDFRKYKKEYYDSETMNTKYALRKIKDTIN